VLVAVLGVFGAAMAWAGSAVAARLTTPHAREVLASLMLTALGVIALAAALGEFGVTRPVLPRPPAAPRAPADASLMQRALTIALVFGVTMAIFSPLSTYALMIGWVAARQSAWLGAVTLMAYGLGLMVPLAVLGTLAAARGEASAGLATERMQERLRFVSGVSLAVAGGFLLSMWTLRATWALFV